MQQPQQSKAVADRRWNVETEERTKCYYSHLLKWGVRYDC